MPDTSPIRLVALGGLGEFGLNSMVLEWGAESVLVDAGVGFGNAELPGVDSVYGKAEGAKRFELPLDREGDVVVIGDTGTCIGAAEADHDLSGLKGHRLRTHGGIPESRVPFILNYPLRPEYAARAAAAPLRSYQLFDFAINGIDSSVRSA